MTHGEPMPVVRRLWLRPSPGPGGLPEERSVLELRAGQGVVGDHAYGRLRHVTLLFEDDWADACRALGRVVDPAARRANVLLSGGPAGAWIGRTVCLGTARVQLLRETRPCAVMDRAAPGLQDALASDGRGGVWGRVLEGGVVRPGDALRAEDGGDDA